MAAVLEPAQAGPTGPQGAPGDPGDTGPAGPPGGSFEHTQVAPASVWGPIAHNLGYYPAVTVVDSAGTGVTGRVEHIDRNSLRIRFTVPFSGVASMS